MSYLLNWALEYPLGEAAIVTNLILTYIMQFGACLR